VICPATQALEHRPRRQPDARGRQPYGGYGITEDWPGFLANKWMDAQLEATYEAPKPSSAASLTVTMTSEVFLAELPAGL